MFDYDDEGNLKENSRWEFTLDAENRLNYRNRANLRVTEYEMSLLNQIEGRSNPDYVGVVGMADASASVTVNLNPAVRKGAYWSGEAVADNAAGPVWQAITNIAVLENGANPHIARSSKVII